MREFEQWWSEYKPNMEYSDRDICRDAFEAGYKAGMEANWVLAAADIADDSVGFTEDRIRSKAD